MISFRLLEPPDLGFIVDSWVKSYRDSDSAGMIARESWRAVMCPEVVRITKRDGAVTMVAYDTDVTDHIADLAGYICADPSESPPVVFYVYVKEAQRKAGYARALFHAVGIDPSRPFVYTAKTGALAAIAEQRKIPCAWFDPSIARVPKGSQQRKRR